jgi:hypothetical protein
MKTRTYSRDGGEVPLAEFLADVAKQTGVKARGQELEPELLQRWGVNPIVVRPNYRGAGFWEIMDDLCARHSLYYVPVQEGYFGKGDDTRIRLMRDRNPLTAGQGRPSFVRYLGPLRFCLSQVGFEAESAVHYRADRHEIHEKLGLWVIAGTLMLPGVRTLRRSAGIQECITNAGENLVTLADRDPSADSHTLKGTRYLRDPRSPRITSTHDDGGPNFGESFPIDPGAVPASLARVRIYYYTDVYDEDAVFELAKLGEPGEHPLGDDFLLKWHGIIEEYGRREARLTLERKAGKSPVGYPYDVLRRVELLDQAGERISGGISHHEDTNLCRLFLRDGAVPVKLRVPYPKGLRTYAGFVVFRDIPLVPLPGRR